MEVSEWLLFFFGGGGLVGVASLYLTKEKQRYDKDTAMVDRLMKELERVDSLVTELRGMINQKDETIQDKDKEIIDKQEQLLKEKQANAELNILVVKLEDELRKVRGRLKEMQDSRKRREKKDE